MNAAEKERVVDVKKKLHDCLVFQGSFSCLVCMWLLPIKAGICRLFEVEKPVMQRE